MNDYSVIGLDSRLRSVNSLSNRIPGYDFYQTDKLNNIRSARVNTSKINVENFISMSAVGSANGTFSSSASLAFSTTLSYVKPFASARMFAIPYIALYQGVGTVGTNQIWPSKGSGVTAGRYDVQGAFDFGAWNGTSSKFAGIITDTNGTSTQAVTLMTKWWHTDYKSNSSE